ncbi:MAG: hypothetical protein IPG63_15235 [Xanthomonadales bacterium]|nr:hypothetical protein [Xanthomonadales bacterium]
MLGLHLAECREYAEGDYAPSHCGDEEVVVFELDGPADSVESEAVELSVRAAGMMLGSRFGPTRSACLGLATRAVVKRVSADGNKVRLELNARFSLRSQAAKPRDCGERTINRTFEVESRALDVRRNGSKQLFMDSHW